MTPEDYADHLRHLRILVTILNRLIENEYFTENNQIEENIQECGRIYNTLVQEANSLRKTLQVVEKMKEKTGWMDTLEF